MKYPRIPWTTRRSNQSILRKSVLNILWKDWCWSWSFNPLVTWWDELTHWKRPWCWERLKAGGEGDDRGWDVGWHHQLDGLEFEQALGVGDGQGGLACCSLWGRKESDMTERLNWNEHFLWYCLSRPLVCISISKFLIPHYFSKDDS